MHEILSKNGCELSANKLGVGDWLTLSPFPRIMKEIMKEIMKSFRNQVMQPERQSYEQLFSGWNAKKAIEVGNMGTEFIRPPIPCFLPDVENVFL